MHFVFVILTVIFLSPHLKDEIIAPGPATLYMVKDGSVIKEQGLCRRNPPTAIREHSQKTALRTHSQPLARDHIKCREELMFLVQGSSMLCNSLRQLWTQKVTLRGSLTWLSGAHPCGSTASSQARSHGCGQLGNPAPCWVNMQIWSGIPA